jgi:asparagine synthase (glutamine-hydrolysing)
LSFQAGISYPDGREIPEAESGAIQNWLQCGDGEPAGSHRGPGAFLAHVPSGFRQRAADESQPCFGRSGVITFDGRLDNRPDLLLRLRGVLRADAGDAALAMAAYETWGIEGFAHLIGDWSLAIWDQAQKTVVLASDFAGVRPLYYCVEPDRVFWSTRLGPLADWAQISEMDDVYVAGLLKFSGCPNRTPYRGVYPVPPGHAVVVTAEGAKIQRFWSLPLADTIRYRRESEYEDHLRSLFGEAVRCRIPAGAGCLCELSGGFDSSSVVSMAAELVRIGAVEPKRLVTLSFEHAGSLDQPFYTAVEQFHGLESVHLPTADYPFLQETEAGGALPEFWGPLHKHIAETARQLGTTTYLTGLLGDNMMANWRDDSEQVAGLLYDFRLGSACKQAFAWSKVLRIPIAWILGRALLSNLPLWLGAGSGRGLTGWNVAPEDREDSVAPAFRRSTGLSGTRTLFSEEWMHARPEHRKHFRSLMQTLELRKLQPSEPMEHLAYTHPYAHRPLVTFMLSIPADVACRPGEPRRLMRRAFHELWPPKLRNRRSKDVFAGVFLESLRPLADDLLKSGRPLRVVENGYVDRESLLKRLERLSHALSCNESQLRNIILLEYWLRSRESRPSSAAISGPA